MTERIPSAKREQGDARALGSSYLHVAIKRKSDRQGVPRPRSCKKRTRDKLGDGATQVHDTAQASISIKKNTFVTRGVANEPELSLLKKEPSIWK
jgi:hypothetical protein